MKLSDCLLLLLNVTNGIEPYNIDYYFNKLIDLGYVDLNEFKYVLTDKGKEIVRRML